MLELQMHATRIQASKRLGYSSEKCDSDSGSEKRDSDARCESRDPASSGPSVLPGPGNGECGRPWAKRSLYQTYKMDLRGRERTRNEVVAQTARRRARMEE